MAEMKHLVTIEAPAGKVYRALTRQEGLAGWWTVETVAEAKVGGILEFTFGDEYYDKMRVTRLEPDRRVEWECLEGHHEWVGTTFVFDLKENEGTTTRNAPPPRPSRGIHAARTSTRSIRAARTPTRAERPVGSASTPRRRVPGIGGGSCCGSSPP